MQTTPMSVCFSSPKTVCSLGQEMLKCQRSAHPLRNSSTLTPSGPSGHTPSHSQAVCWYCCHTSHMWPPICGDVCRSAPELVSTCSEWQRLRLSRKEVSVHSRKHSLWFSCVYSWTGRGIPSKILFPHLAVLRLQLN